MWSRSQFRAQLSLMFFVILDSASGFMPFLTHTYQKRLKDFGLSRLRFGFSNSEDVEI